MTKETQGAKGESKPKSWTVSIPCSVEWDDTIIEGTIDNLSYTGAVITEMKVAPPEGALVTVKFQVEKEELKVEGVLTSKVIYTVREISEEVAAHSFGVEFQEPLEKVSSQLTPLFLRLQRERA
ncbi:PilZ domain-containing protein, partial [Acidobacteria bacterium AH-259-O06]|nr:PilZ domain-containing protein [Acidobacteria bacterium AH-259-O06]